MPSHTAAEGRYKVEYVSRGGRTRRESIGWDSVLTITNVSCVWELTGPSPQEQERV